MSNGRRLGQKLATIYRLSVPEKVALIRAAAIALAAWSGLRVLSLPRLVRALGFRVADRDHPPASERLLLTELSDRERLGVWAVRTLTRKARQRGNCLKRSLVIGHVLRQRDPFLRLGVIRHDGECHAHAWIEINGRALDLDMISNNFVPLRSTASVGT